VRRRKKTSGGSSRGIEMTFRERLLDHLEISKTIKKIDPKKIEAFTRRDLETAIQLYLHLKRLGHTFDDLIRHIEYLRKRDNRDHEYLEIEAAMKLGREERKHIKKNRGLNKPRRG
jgi:hypothetical protein